MMRLVSTARAILSASVAWAGDARVNPSVYFPYTARSSPRIAAKWGPDALPGINRFRKEAAMKVARFKECDGILTSQLSESRSVAPDTLVVVVVCRNGRRFYLSREDVTNGDGSSIAPGNDHPA